MSNIENTHRGDPFLHMLGLLGQAENRPYVERMRRPRAVDHNLDIEPGTGTRAAADAPADFTWTSVDVDGSQFTRNPACRDGFTYHAVQRRPKPAHRAPVFPYRRAS